LLSGSTNDEEKEYYNFYASLFRAFNDLKLIEKLLATRILVIMARLPFLLGHSACWLPVAELVFDRW
jgi:hypothetical protein